MPIARIKPDCDLHYRVDDFTDPWGKPETVLMVHGNHEGGTAWYGWVPALARHYRVVRPDTRGFADSTPMPRDFPWSMDLVIDDYLQLMDSLGIERFHLVGAKIGGTIARAFAARRPERVSTLTVVGSPEATRPDGKAALLQAIETLGVEERARRGMSKRLGTHFPPEAVEWWIKFMARTPLSTVLGFVNAINFADISADIPKIRCPMLVITTEGSSLASIGQTRAWQEQVKGSELLVLPGDSYHIAVTDPDRCAQATLDFIRRRGGE
jgi:pimeloyl-ACP methyl ester carboxylesterase